MASVLLVEAGFFPLDEELHLVPGSLTPRLHEALVRLSTPIPSFAKAAGELAWFTGVTVHPDTARRRTEAAGALLVAHETTEATRILHDQPTTLVTPDTLLVRVDGAFIPRVHGQWTEVRTLAVGEVVPVDPPRNGARVQTTNRSSFSRRADSTHFADLARNELHRRGIEGARRVGAVMDGAPWCQRFIDLHYPEAVRIGDFVHAATSSTRIGQSVGPDGPLLDTDAQALVRHTLKHAGPEVVLDRLRTVVACMPEQAALMTYLTYLETRVARRALWDIWR